MFNWFNNMRMGTKLLVSFLGLAIIVGLTLGVLGYYNLTTVNQIILEIVDQRVPSVKNATGVERYALRTIMDEKQYLLAANDSRMDASTFQKSAMSNIDEIIKALDAVDAVATKYNDTDLLAKSKEVRTVTLQYKDLYNQGVAKLTTNNELATVMATNGTTVTTLSKEFFNAKVGKTDEQTLQQIPILVDIWDTALETRINQNKYMLYRDVKYYTDLTDGIKKLATRYDDLQKVTTDAADLQKIADARTATDAYSQAAADWVKNDDELTAILAQMSTIGTKVQENAVAAEDAGWLAAEATKESSAAVVSQAILITVVAVIIAIVLGVVLGVVISRSITGPLGIAVAVGKSLSVGDLVRGMTDTEKDKVRLRQDEIGDLGKAFDQLIIYMQELGNAAGTIAKNDLTTRVTSKSAKDELSNAFIQMIEGLRKAVGQVADSARNLSSASGQLATAAKQAGEATNQIAATVQQVAKGTQDQAQAVTRTAGSVEQMSRAIEGVAKGAGEQGNAVAKASEITADINTIIQQVAGNAAAVTRDSAAAAEAARNGATTVEETLQGMQSIKSKVGVSAQKVQEMGERSNEIGAIVETIQDIASQTNLLALNAAIEAARAGEHGKGFAVVADEVRKLAERSSQATKEIGGLIGGIQKTVAEAVKAMDEGSKEVENGVKSANKAGDALSAILNAAEAVNKQAQQAAEGTQKMNVASNQLVTSVDSVSAVVEENTAATEEMAANSGEVTQAIESIASVSEENSAAIEEVSASAEEMSAQVEEVTASADSLAEMARVLAQVVAQFKLS
jgi:methyl-accepting chemotaxis protein